MLKLYNDKSFWRDLARIGLPIAFQNLLVGSLALVDTLMVGKLNDVSIAAVGMAAQIALFANIVIFGITSGGAVFIAQYWGRKDMKGISKAFGLMLISVPAATLLSLIATAFPAQVMGVFTEDQAVIALGASYLRIACFSYIGVALSQTLSSALRCIESVKLSMLASGVSVLANTFLNYALIFGKFGLPELGVEGAAISTLIAAFLPPIIMTVVLLFSKKNVLIKSPKVLFNISPAFFKEFMKRSLPVLANESLWVLGVMVSNMIFGRMGTQNYSALSIFRTVENIAFVFFIGLCNACNVTVAKKIGAGDIAGAKLHSKRFLLLVPFIALIAGLGVILMRNPMLSIFNISLEVHTTAATLLIIYGCHMTLRNIPYISIVGIFRAGGDTKTGMKYDLLCLWGIALPITALCGLVLKLPFVYVYLIMLLSEDVIKNLLCLKRYRSMKWIQPVASSSKYFSEQT